MMTLQNKQRVDRKGTATLEFAFVAVPFFLLIFACIEFARVGMVEAMAEDAAFQAAREIMVAGSTKAEGVAEANRVLGIMGITPSSIVVAARERDGTVQAEINDDTSEMTVTVNVDMADNSLYLNAFSGRVTFVKTCTVAAERYKGYYDGVGS